MCHFCPQHETTTASGTYYVDVPPRAGRLVLEDPRGALPPFGKHVSVTPRAGELLLW